MPVTRRAAAAGKEAAADAAADKPQQPEVAEELEEAPAPFTHALLVAGAALPLFVHVPANLNILVLPTFTIFAGAWRSVKIAGPPSETMTQKDAMRFPLIGSCVLFSLFIAFKFLPKELINTVLSAYFAFLGIVALAATAAPFIGARLPASISRKTISAGTLPKIPLLLDEPWELAATIPESIGGVGATALCMWYFKKKHWLANNALGLAFSVQGIEHLSLGSTQTGAMLLGGLFFYDIFWVFCTPVMVSVAKSFDAPIKLLFPRGETNPDKPPFSMLGLGDIVIPGFFLALMLRMDVAHGRTGSPRYFRAAMTGYVLGLGTTIAVMNIFNAAQPALLYIVPGVLGAVALRAAAAGELKEVFNWEEANPEEGADAAAAATKAD